MVIKYDIEISNKAVEKNIERITNQVFKLLPNREEGNDWQTPLKNLIVEIGGMSHLFFDQSDLFRLLCKLEGLYDLNGEDDFLLFRTTIFECLTILSRLKQCLA